MKMGSHSIKDRTFFNEDEEFPDSLKNLLDGYNEAARMSAITAKQAAKKGTLKAIRESQWWETVAQTIEECLHAAIDRDTEFSMPTPPEFDVQ